MNLSYRKNAGMIIINENKEMLIVRKEKTGKFPVNEWQIVQEGAEKGESWHDTIKRGLKEELDVHEYKIIAESKYIKQYDWPKEYQKIRHFKGQKQNLFVLEISKKASIKLQEEELAEYKWIHLSELKNYIKKEDTIKSIDAVKKEFPSLFE